MCGRDVLGELSAAHRGVVEGVLARPGWAGDALLLGWPDMDR